MEYNFEFLSVYFFLLEKSEKLNIKFRLAKEGEFAEGETESTTIQLVLEQSEPDAETNKEAASLMRANQETCSSPQKDPESSPWLQDQPWTRFFTERRAVNPCHRFQIRKSRLFYGQCFS